MDYELETIAEAVGYICGFGRYLIKMEPENAKRYCQNSDPRSPAYETIHEGVPYAPRTWTNGQLSEADRQGFSRAVKSLTRFKLIVPFCRGTRTSHLRATARGVRVGIAALRRLGEEPDLEGLARGLAVVAWATEEHVATVEQELRRQQAATAPATTSEGPTERPPADQAGEAQQTQPAAPAAQ